MCSLNQYGICINYLCSCEYIYVHDPWNIKENNKPRSVFSKIIGSFINLIRKPKDYRRPNTKELIHRKKQTDKMRKKYGLEED
jgi:hypothetical protein